MLICFFNIFMTSVGFSLPEKIPQRKVHHEASLMLRKAKEMVTAGNFSEAEIFFAKARLYSPQIQRPYWLDQPLNIAPANPIPDERKSLLEAIKAASQYLDLFKGKLEALLKKSPSDREVRNYLLQFALKKKDAQGINRHKSALKMAPEPQEGSFWKIVFSFLLFVLIAWQVKNLFVEIKELRKNGL